MKEVTNGIWAMTAEIWLKNVGIAAGSVRVASGECDLDGGRQRSQNLGHEVGS